MLNLILVAMLSQTPMRTYEVKYIDCYDGDTCEFHFPLGLSITATHHRVRLCDINAPEIRKLATREAATVTRDALRSWIKAAKLVQVSIPQESNCPVGHCDKRDKFGRWLGYILADGVDLNKKLLNSGLAVAYLSCQ